MMARLESAAPGESRADDPLLAARIKSFETAFGMQAEMPEVVRPVAGNRRDARALRPGARQHDGLRLAMPGRPPAGRARRAVRRADRHRLVGQLGRARRHDRPRAARQERRPADRRAAARPEAARACSTTRWSSGRRSSAAPRSTAAPTPPAASIITGSFPRGWPAAGVKPGIVHGATDEYGIDVGQGSGPRPRLPRHDPAPDGPRSRPADLSATPAATTG